MLNRGNQKNLYTLISATIGWFSVCHGQLAAIFQLDEIFVIKTVYLLVFFVASLTIRIHERHCHKPHHQRQSAHTPVVGFQATSNSFQAPQLDQFWQSFAIYQHGVWKWQAQMGDSGGGKWYWSKKTKYSILKLSKLVYIARQPW